LTEGGRGEKKAASIASVSNWKVRKNPSEKENRRGMGFG